MGDSLQSLWLDDDDSPNDNSNSNNNNTWIRGVNLGGWLVLERYIVPYQFAVTNCHLDGDPCWYPGQASVNTTFPDYKLCDIERCRPHLTVPETGGDPDYPIDEYSLGRAFLQHHQVSGTPLVRAHNPGLPIAEEWLNVHLDNFITHQDLQALKEAGVTHLRVPLPHWIRGDVEPREPWIVGRRWQTFLRLLQSAERLRFQVWPDIHTAPGSQNNFDNGGRATTHITCTTWSDHPAHVERSLRAVRSIAKAIRDAGYGHVVTGFGLLNEPFKDCNRYVYRDFIQAGKEIVRDVLGEGTAVYVSDMFLAKTFNDGTWWLDPNQYENTYLDSHYYHVFAEYPRELSPRQHIAFTCQHDWKDATSCCYKDARPPWYWPWQRTHQHPSQGVQHIVGEWSAAYDTLPALRLQEIMVGIAQTGVAPYLDHQLSAPEKDFCKHFVQAQMVAYESVDTGTSAGWFFWTAKMEGGAFIDWDFLRGVAEGWIPTLPPRDQASEHLYGSCYDILFKTADNTEEVIHSFPDPNHLSPGLWFGPVLDDDVVLTHGDSLLLPDGIHHVQRHRPSASHITIIVPWIVVGILLACALKATQRLLRTNNKQSQYSEITTVEL